MRGLKEKLEFTLEALRDFGSVEFEDSFKLKLYDMNKANDKEADIFLIENAAEFDSYEMFTGATEDSSWRFRYVAIARGDYPLEKLPPHVRDIAERLYYTQSGTAQHIEEPMTQLA